MQRQYGHTLQLDSLDDASNAEKLIRLHLSKEPTNEFAYEEAWLQRLIMRHPSLLPIDQIEPAFSPLVPICVELPMQCGFVDNLYATPAGDLVLVECKLWRNPEARRKVIAQIIDYASELSTWTYEHLDRAIGRTKHWDAAQPSAITSLYESVAAAAEIDEVSFHDAVCRNLRRGRVLLLIVGDGIREDAEALTEFLQQHAGFHFTLALVEVALFKARVGYIAQPRVLARTTNIERAIVALDEGRIVLRPLSSLPGGSLASVANKTSITQERYFEQLEQEIPKVSIRLGVFLNAAADYYVTAEFGSDNLILRWRTEGKSWNLATISTRGQVFMDSMSLQANNAGHLEALKRYLHELARVVPGAVVKQGRSENSLSLAINGRTATLDALLADDVRLNTWVRAIAEFQSAVSNSDSTD